MRELDPENIKRRENWLIFTENRPAALECDGVVLPFGCGFDPGEHTTYLDTDNDEPRILASESEEPEDAVQLYPPYHATETIDSNEFGEINIEIFTINRESNRQISQSLISRLHYLSSVPNGLYIGCRFKDTQMQKQIREQRKKEFDQDPKFESIGWSEPLGRVIGCATVDDLLFGIPRGRDKFAANILDNPNWREDLKQAEKERRKQDREPRPDELTRSKLVRKLKLAWGSRFAVDDPYQDLGIGTVLAEHMKPIAANYRLPSADRIEVIRREKKGKVNELCDENHPRTDFLLNAGYDIVEEAIRYSQPRWKLKNGKRIPPSLLEESDQNEEYERVYRKVYYYDEIDA